MALPDLCSTAMWVKFFTDSGIPNSVAANYAVTFYDNRITRNMLLDLNKEILQDMGISVMGDVIAILKHAKVVHAQMTREKVYSSETSIASISPVTLIQKAKPNTIQSNRLASRLGNVTVQSNPPSTAKNVVLRKRSLQEEVPVTKVRRVLPEHEGPYKITMPTGKTAKTRKLLLKKNAATVTKESVFRRLGSDTNEGASTSAIVQPKVVTKRQLKPAAASKVSSVFERLGPEKGTAVEETLDDDDVITMDDDEDDELSLEYEGILLSQEKPVAIQKRVIVSPAVKTVRAQPLTSSIRPLIKSVGTKIVPTLPLTRLSKAIGSAATSSSNSSQGIMGGLSGPTMTSVYSRLGKKVTIQPKAITMNTSAVVTKKLVSRAPKAVLKKKAIGNIISTKKMNAGIKARLGKTSVFGRLGPVVDV